MGANLCSMCAQKKPKPGLTAINNPKGLRKRMMDREAAEEWFTAADRHCLPASTDSLGQPHRVAHSRSPHLNPLELTFRMSASTPPGDSDVNLAVTWADRALVSAAAFFFYDYLLTFANEIGLYQNSARDRKLLWSFLPLRYLPAFYQLLMVMSVIEDSPTFSTTETIRCSAFDKIALGLDTSFQLCYIGIISWRVKVINGTLFALPLMALGLSPPIINIAVSNPSVFPRCRLLNPVPTTRCVPLYFAILPCLRAAFDAATTLALLAKLWRHIASMGALASNTVSFVLTEGKESNSAALIFTIMAMEAVFVQARAHARNFVVPFVDSLTAILTTRFMLELEEKGRDRRKSGRRSSRGVLPSTTLVESSPSRKPSDPGPPDDSSSSLHTFETRSIGWNRVGSCLGARAF
ncbi:hypothetical protein B0H16DRAFT_1631176 [Mycena metata]|uniref:DUF6533 domain-containing protein n=1 Tax=Mycena metata TaxID=1033252 RepID=A0AAD7H0C3_9AGAR|nr:hypothetical protein B0H16DRAFT_1631176 [Mycena metata]